MADISSVGINSYVSQQAAQHKTKQAAPAVGSDEAQKPKETSKSLASQRGVIIQISKEGRDLAKAASTEDNSQMALIVNRTREDLQTAIVNAMQRQSELQENINQSDTSLADQQNRELIANDVKAA